MIPNVELRPSFAPLRHLRNLYVGIEGVRGSGKTRSILTELMCRALEYPGCRIILARHDRTDLTKTVLETLEKQVFPLFGMATPGNQSAESRSVYDLPNGSQLIPMGLRELTKVQSFEATFAYVNEAGECAQRQITELAATLRWLKTPERPSLPDWNQLIFDINPIYPGAWPNKLMEDADDSLRACLSNGAQTREQYAAMQAHNWKPFDRRRSKAKRLITKHMDNPGYWDFEKWDWTPIGRTYVEETLGSYTGYLRDRWLKGLWVAAEGSVFPEFDKKKNVVKDFVIPESWPVVLCADPGYDHPCGISWNALAPNGTSYTIADIKVRQTGLDRLVELIDAKRIGVIKELCDPAGKQRTQGADGKSFRDQMAIRGHRMTPWKFAAEEDHDTSVQAHRQAIVDGKYKIFESCVDTIAEHESWSFKRLRGGEMPTGDDQYQDENNDLIDGILGYEREKIEFPKAPGKPPPPVPTPAAGVIAPQEPV